MTGRFQQKDIDHYHAHGYVLLENFLSDQELTQIQTDLDGVIPGWRQAVDPTLPRPDGWQAPREFYSNKRFPFTCSSLNEMTFHPELLRFAETVCGHRDFFCDQSDLTYKCKGHRRDSDQPMHMDFGNHTLVYPSSNPKYWQVTYLVYYTDVTDMHAPTAIVPWGHYKDEVHWPILHTPKERPDLYEREIMATVPAGSVLAYSTLTYHRGTAFKGDVGRVGHFVSYSPKDCPWVGIVSWPGQAASDDYHTWVESSSEQERELLGFPPPGHDYWTPETVRGTQARFPKLDMSPYVNALQRREL
ncbi:MAG: phytanoyl-CoA dioxygenase family protein [Pseudomonadota bacterium]